jgi:hypothetical protein
MKEQSIMRMKRPVWHSSPVFGWVNTSSTCTAVCSIILCKAQTSLVQSEYGFILHRHRPVLHPATTQDTTNLRPWLSDRRPVIRETRRIARKPSMKR